MNGRHATVISLFLALALVAGMFAALRTTTLGARSQSVSTAQLAAKSRQLDRYEARLSREARRKPPALPSVPAGAAAAPAPQVVYRRPAPIVHVVHRHGGELEHESEGDGGDD